MRRTSREPAEVWVLRLSVMTMATRPRSAGTCHSSTHLLAEHIGCASRSDPAIEPAITPVDQAKAIDLAIIPRCFDQPLPTSPLATPDTREGRMKGHLHLILQIQVRVRQECQQRFKV